MQAQVDHQQVEMESTACPLCDSERSKPTLRGCDLLHLQPGEFQLVRCLECGHHYLNPRPTLDAIGRYYPADYGPHRLEQTGDGDAPAGRLRGLLRNISWLRRLVLWFLESRALYVPDISTSPKTALELGCADGTFLQSLKDQGWQVQGVEFSIEAAHRAAGRGLKVHAGTLESAELPAGKFDAVFAWMVLEHLHDPRATLRQFHRLLKQDGYLMFSVPNFGCWEPHLLRGYWYALDMPRHLQQFTPGTIRQLLAETGFEVERIIHQRNVNNIVGSLGYWWRARFPGSTLARKWIDYCDDPATWGLLLLAPLAKVLAWLRQSGRLTVVARPISGSGNDTARPVAAK